MHLSEGIPLKTSANPQACGQNINRANLYENEMVPNISRFKLLRSISYKGGGVSNGGGFPIWTCPSVFVLSMLGAIRSLPSKTHRKAHPNRSAHLCHAVSLWYLSVPKSGVAKRGRLGGGVPDLDLSFLLCPFLSLLGLFGTFLIFPGF